MKYVVVLGDGMADEPLEELSGMTPLEKAVTPAMDALAKQSEMGLLCTIPEGGFEHRCSHGRYGCGVPLQSGDPF